MKAKKEREESSSMSERESEEQISQGQKKQRLKITNISNLTKREKSSPKDYKNGRKKNQDQCQKKSQSSQSHKEKLIKHEDSLRNDFQDFRPTLPSYQNFYEMFKSEIYEIKQRLKLVQGLIRVPQSQHKKPKKPITKLRRKASQIKRIYKCIQDNCQKAYGTKSSAKSHMLRVHKIDRTTIRFINGIAKIENQQIFQSES